MDLDRSGNVFPAVTPCTQRLCWLIYTPTYHNSDISLAWYISFICSDRHMKVQQEQDWRREKGGKGAHCCLKIAVSVFYSLHIQVNLNFIPIIR